MSTVLIAEDEEALLDVLCEAVGGLGHDILRAADGEEALLLARGHPPDLVITDHMMPRRSGMELVDALRGEPRLAAVPVIVMSAVKPRGVERAHRYLAKPVALADFERAVTEALGSNGHGPHPAPPAPPAAQSSTAPRALEETLQWVAHELKNPISSAQLGAQLLRKRLGEDAGGREREAIDMILRQLARMNVFVSSVLDAAQLREGRLVLDRRPLDLEAWLTEILDDWRAQRPQFVFTLVRPAEPLIVRADGPRLRQVVDNLLSNAVKHGSPPERVEVRVDVAPGVVHVRVRDQGAGIPAADLPRIFDRFHRAGNSAGGHGLGLTIASSLARLHGGMLSVESELRRGSTFTLTVPRT